MINKDPAFANFMENIAPVLIQEYKAHQKTKEEFDKKDSTIGAIDDPAFSLMENTGEIVEKTSEELPKIIQREKPFRYGVYDDFRDIGFNYGHSVMGYCFIDDVSKRGFETFNRSGGYGEKISVYVKPNGECTITFGPKKITDDPWFNRGNFGKYSGQNIPYQSRWSCICFNLSNEELGLICDIERSDDFKLSDGTELSEHLKKYKGIKEGVGLMIPFYSKPKHETELDKKDSDMLNTIIEIINIANAVQKSYPCCLQILNRGEDLSLSQTIKLAQFYIKLNSDKTLNLLSCHNNRGEKIYFSSKKNNDLAFADINISVGKDVKSYLKNDVTLDLVNGLRSKENFEALRGLIASVEKECKSPNRIIEEYNKIITDGILSTKNEKELDFIIGRIQSRMERKDKLSIANIDKNYLFIMKAKIILNAKYSDEYGEHLYSEEELSSYKEGDFSRLVTYLYDEFTAERRRR